MNTNFIVGVLIIAVLLGGIISTVAYPIIVELKPKPVEKVFVKEFFTASLEPEIKKISLNFLVRSGSLNLRFTDEPIAYKFKFTSKTPIQPEIVKQKVGSLLKIFVYANSCKIDILLGNRYVYSGNFTLFSGGGEIELSKYTNIENFDFNLGLGGLTVDIFDNTSFSNLNIKVSTGGVMLNVKATTLPKNSTINVKVGTGGITVQPIMVLNSVGCKIKGFVGTGGISLNPLHFEVIKKTKTECEIITKNYGKVKANLDINLHVNVGGILLNRAFPIFVGR